MREVEKQSLISRAEQLIKHAGEARDEIPFGLGDDVEGELTLVKIALASLTAEPVYQERRYQFIGKRQLEYWADINKSTYGYLPESERRLIYTAPPAPVMRAVDLTSCRTLWYDHDDLSAEVKCIPVEDVKKAIRAAGYETQK